MTMIRTASSLVHVSSTGSREIHAFGLVGETGELERLEVIAVPGSGAPTRGNIPLVWSRDGRILYAQVRTEPFPLSAFALDAGSRRLRRVGSVDLPAPMAYLSFSRNGRFLLGASYDSGLLVVGHLDASGLPVTAGLQVLATPPKAHCILESPFGAFVYATTVDGEAILVYRLDDDSGRLEATSRATMPTRPGDGPRHLVFHPALDRLYCINEHGGSVAVYRVDRASGELEALQQVSLMPSGFSGNARAADIHVTPDGLFLYASVRSTDAITVFGIDRSTGLLSEAGRFPVAGPRAFTLDTEGRFLLCTEQKHDRIAVFARDATHGGLELVGRHPVGRLPGWIECRPAPAPPR